MFFDKENFDINNQDQVMFVTERAFTLFGQMREQIKLLSDHRIIPTDQESEEQVEEYLRNNWFNIVSCQPINTATQRYDARIYEAAFNFMRDLKERQDLKEVIADPAFTSASLKFFTGK